MEADAGYGNKTGLSRLTEGQRTLLFTSLGVIGLVLGFLFQVIGGIGVLLLWSALILSVPAWRDMDRTDWSQEILNQCYALSVFGGMAVLGFIIRMFLEIFA